MFFQRTFLTSPFNKDKKDFLKINLSHEFLYVLNRVGNFFSFFGKLYHFYSSFFFKANQSKALQSLQYLNGMTVCAVNFFCENASVSHSCIFFQRNQNQSRLPPEKYVKIVFHFIVCFNYWILFYILSNVYIHDRIGF